MAEEVGRRTSTGLHLAPCDAFREWADRHLTSASTAALGEVGKAIGGLSNALGGARKVGVYPVRKSLGGNIEVLINVNAQAQCAGFAGTKTAAADAVVNNCALSDALLLFGRLSNH